MLVQLMFCVAKGVQGASHWEWGSVRYSRLCRTEFESDVIQAVCVHPRAQCFFTFPVRVIVRASGPHERDLLRSDGVR